MDSFFGIGIPELLLILIIAGVVMGPERIGIAARWLGRTTAQLQSISRGFMAQLNAELDGIQETEEVKGAIKDVQDLRSQLDQLKKELSSVSNGAIQEGRQALRDTQAELEKTIAPPSMRALTDSAARSAATNGTAQELPTRIQVSDDPES